jgi:hypothetical protein
MYIALARSIKAKNNSHPVSVHMAEVKDRKNAQGSFHGEIMTNKDEKECSLLDHPVLFSKSVKASCAETICPRGETNKITMAAMVVPTGRQ